MTEIQRPSAQKAGASTWAKLSASERARQEDAEALGGVTGQPVRPTRPRKQASPGDVPPYCYLLLGMSVEEGAAAAVKSLHITHACDALSILWELQRVALEPASGTGEYQPTHPGDKSPYRAMLQVSVRNLHSVDHPSASDLTRQSHQT